MSLRLSVISDLDACERLWNKWSPKKSVFDTWEMRRCFYDAYGYQPYFILAKQGNREMGLLPLWHDTDQKRYEWFGSNWHEDHTFWARDPEVTLTLLAAAPKPTRLLGILSPSIGTQQLEKYVDKYVFDFDTIKTVEGYLERFASEDREKLRKKLKQIERSRPRMIMNRVTDLGHLFKFNIARFKETPEKHGLSSFLDPRRRVAFRNMAHLDGQVRSRLISVIIHGKPAAVGLAAQYNGTYFSLNSGSDRKKFLHITPYLITRRLEDALTLGATRFDALEGDYGWKQHWMLTPVPLYKWKNG